VVAGHLRYRAWRPGEALVPDACRIPAPAGAAALKPDELSLLLVPTLALDQPGIRLGSGGGWYDRLRADPAWRAIPALAVLPAACITRDLPRDPWDVPFDGWLDERGLHWLQAV
jgi:5-formyltetrahydrofolate cyclo-ligase